MWDGAVCLICLKVIKESSSRSITAGVSKSNQYSLFRNFVVVSERLLNLPESVISSLHCAEASRTLADHVFCPDCETLVTVTHQLYKDLCAVQLKLGWRMKQLQGLLENQNQLSAKLSFILQKRVGKQLDLPGGSNQVGDVRRQISKHCSKYHRSQKHVSIPLQRISHVKVATPSDQVIVNKSCLTFPAENCTVDFIKVEKENDGDNSDQDFQDSYFNDVNFTGESDGEGGSPPTKRVKKEENLVSTTVSDISTPPGCRELRPKKIIKYHTRRDPTKKIKIEKKKETKIRKIDLEYPPDGRDISDRTCRVCDRHVSTSVRLLRIHLRKHENKWKRRNKLVRPPLQCYFCFYSFAYDHSLQNHLELVAHTQCLAKGKFICSEGNCDNIQFHNFSELNNHFEKDHSGDSLFRCALCQWPFLNDEMREVHELVHIKHHQGEGFQCPKCDYKQMFALQIQNHYIKNHTSIPRQDLLVYKCPVCKQRCKYIDVFEEHMKAHEIDKEIKMDTTATSEHVTCKDCGRSFPSMRLLKSHFRVTHRKTQCSKCGQLVITKLINYHMKVIHKEGQPLPCPQCGKLFFGSDRLRKHIQGMHDSERAPKQCHICQKEYQRGAMLDKHLKDVHQVEVDALKVPPKFICSECGKGYRFQGSLEQHVDAKHTKESDRRWNFRCDMCDKSFCRQSLLNKHKTEVHSSEVSPPTGGSDPSA